MVVYCCTTQNKLNGGPTTHNAVGRSEREAVKARKFGMANGRALVGHRRLVADELQEPVQIHPARKDGNPRHARILMHAICRLLANLIDRDIDPSDSEVCKGSNRQLHCAFFCFRPLSTFLR